MHVPDQIAARDRERDQGEENSCRGGSVLRGIQVDSRNYPAPLGWVSDLRIIILLGLGLGLLKYVHDENLLQVEVEVRCCRNTACRANKLYNVLRCCIMCSVLLYAELIGSYLDVRWILADGVHRLVDTV